MSQETTPINPSMSFHVTLSDGKVEERPLQECAQQLGYQTVDELIKDLQQNPAMTKNLQEFYKGTEYRG